uniref:Zinc finger protein 629 n=1 Tax=Mus musculus TaxID=10090 RepID=A0A087WR77_MOUSE
MEPETVLWGPDLQGPEESQNEAHRDSLSVCRCWKWERRGEPSAGKFWGGDHPGRSGSESRIQGPIRDAPGEPLPGCLSPSGFPNPPGFFPLRSPDPYGPISPRGSPFPVRVDQGL